MGDTKGNQPLLRVTAGTRGGAPGALRFDSVAGDSAVVVASLSGALDMNASPVVARQILQTLEDPISSLTMNLANVTFIDSSGLAVLNVARRHALEKKIDFKLRDVPAFVERVLVLAGMRELFDITNTLTDGTTT